MIDRFVAGVVGAPFGVKGFIKIHVPSGESDHLEAADFAVLRLNGTERKYEIEDTAGEGGSFIVKFRGIESPEAAKPMVGAEWMVGREAAAPLDADEFYIEDLRGVAVILAGDGRRVGEIRDVLEGGGGQLIEILLTDGQVRLVPFRDEFFGAVDPAAGTAVLREEWMLE